MSLRVGSLVYATDSGLGILARSFVCHGVVTDPVVVRHGHHVTHDDWYPGAPQITSLRDPKQLRRLEEIVASWDVFLAFETPFHWPLFDHCRAKGVRTALMVMYECTPERMPAEPDLILCPSLLDLKYYPQGVCIPVPVEVEWRQRTRAEVFIHNAGHGGLRGRNGTREVIEAMQYVRSPIKLILRSQDSRSVVGALQAIERDERITLCCNTYPHYDLFTAGDVFVFPTKFDGLSLPLQEARAAGMLVLTGDRFPMNDWLPREPLIPVAGYGTARIGPPYNQFDEARYDPREIAAKIDEWYGADISAYSRAGRAWAETMSWEKLGPVYRETLEALTR
jgi:hypothetical protein